MARWLCLTVIFTGVPALMLSGCGSSQQSESPELIAVTGTVTIGGKPASDVTVRFIPKQGTGGNGAFANTAEDGSYTLKVLSGDEGIPPGEYTVTFSKFAMPDGSKVDPAVQPESVGAVQVLPVRYLHPETSGTDAVVTESSRTFDFDLKPR